MGTTGAVASRTDVAARRAKRWFMEKPRIGVNNLKAPLMTMQYTGVNNTHKFVGTGREIKTPDDKDRHVVVVSAGMVRRISHKIYF